MQGFCVRGRQTSRGRTGCKARHSFDWLTRRLREMLADVSAKRSVQFSLVLGYLLTKCMQICARHLFYLMDADGDGTLDWEELLAWIELLPSALASLQYRLVGSGPTTNARPPKGFPFSRHNRLLALAAECTEKWSIHWHHFLAPSVEILRFTEYGPEPNISFGWVPVLRAFSLPLERGSPGTFPREGPFTNSSTAVSDPWQMGRGC